MSSDPSHPGRVYPSRGIPARRNPASPDHPRPARRALAHFAPGRRNSAHQNPARGNPARRNEARRRAPLSLGLFAVLLAAPIAAATPAQATTDPADGVTVVVDFTDVGGDVEVGFAPGDPGTGREALEAAGFVPTDSTPGMICAIDAMPDPCPEEFEGEFWSYWSGAGADWEAHTEGADGIDPAPGDIEGWRYNDGSVGPQVTPAEAAEQVATGAAADDGDAAEDAPGDDDAASEDDATEDEAADDDTAADEVTDGVTDEADSGLGALWIGVLIAVLLAVLTAVVVWMRRSRRASDGSDASDDGGTESLPVDR